MAFCWGSIPLAWIILFLLLVSAEMAFCWGSLPLAWAILLLLVTAAITVVSTVADWHLGRDEVPIWWDVHGDPLLWAPPWLGYLFMPLLAFVVSGALLLANGSINLKSHGKESKGAVRAIILLPAIFLLATQNAILMVAPDPKFPTSMVVNNFALVYFSFGKIIPRVEPNRVIGIITPWTNDSNWNALHQKADSIFSFSAVSLFLVTMGGPTGWPMLVAVLVLGLGPWVISWGNAYLDASDSNAGVDPKLTTLLCATSPSIV